MILQTQQLVHLSKLNISKLWSVLELQRMASHYYPFFFFSFFFSFRSTPCHISCFQAPKSSSSAYFGCSLQGSISPYLQNLLLSHQLSKVMSTSLHCSSPLFLLPGSSTLRNLCLIRPLSLFWKCPKLSQPCLFVSKVLNLNHPSKNILVLISNPEDQDFAD